MSALTHRKRHHIPLQDSSPRLGRMLLALVSPLLLLLIAGRFAGGTTTAAASIAPQERQALYAAEHTEHDSDEEAAAPSNPLTSFAAGFQSTELGYLLRFQSSNFGKAAPDNTTVPGSDPVLVGAGDIGTCTGTGDDRTANLLDAIPGIVFTLGDNAYTNGSAYEFANCYDPTWGRQKARTHPGIGNHEYYTTNAAPYFSYFGAAAGDPTKGYYSYDVGPSGSPATWHVIVLNANCTKVPCNAGSAQELWLRSELLNNLDKNVLAMWHHPRFSSGTEHGNDPNVQALWQDIYRYGGDLVINGHAHSYERFAPQNGTGVLDTTYGVREIIAGTGGSSHTGFNTPVANSEVRNPDTYGVLKLTLHQDSYDWQFIPEAGGTFTDSGTTLTHGVPPGGGVPTATPTQTVPTTPTNSPTNTPTQAFTSTPTATSTPSPTATQSQTALPTDTVIVAPSNTSVASSTPTWTPVSTSTPASSVTATSTSIATSSATSSPPAVTSTPTLPTSTPANTSTPTITGTRTATPTVTPCTLGDFDDVPAGSTFYPFVRCLVCLGIVSGYPDNTYRPNNSVTRGQLSKIVSNAAGFSEPASGQMFEDVQPGSTFYDFIQRLASRGYINGYPCGSPGEPCGLENRPYFRPANSVTRGQASKIISEAAGFSEVHTSQSFEDVPIGSTFYMWIERLVSRTIMSGYPCGSPGEPCGSGNLPYFRPNNNLTRGQAAKIVSNTFFPACNP